MPASLAASLPTTPRRPARALTLAALAATALLAAPRSADASTTPETYLACVNSVADFTDACKAASGTWYGDVGCVAAGVVGILGCAALEAAEILGRSVGLPDK